MYTALILDTASRFMLLAQVQHLIPSCWEELCHHMTINLDGPECGPAEHLVGQRFKLTVVTLARDDRVMAVGVQTDVPSIIAQKHITIAVNREAGGKPKHSGELQTWIPFAHPIIVYGTVVVVNPAPKEAQ